MLRIGIDMGMAISVTDRRCIECDSDSTKYRRRYRKRDGTLVIYNNWHDDGYGNPLCHTCFSRRWRAGRYKKMGRPSRLSQYQQEHVEFLPVAMLWKKFPAASVLNHRDIFDMVAHILDFISERGTSALTSICISTNMPSRVLMPKLSLMFHYGLVDTRTDNKTYSTVLDITPKGIDFLRLYRKIAELMAYFG